MTTFVMLSTLGPDGSATLRENPARIKEVNAQVEAMGARVVQQYALLGPYDFCNILEAPDDDTAARRIEPDQDVVFGEVAQAPPPAPAPPRAPAGDSPLLSTAASAAVHSAFGTLAHSVLAQNPRTLEDLVKEMLRPMLKAWLDDNLPVMVERMVRAEIERVSRGPRS